MTLGAKVVYFIGLYFLDDTDKVGAVGEISVMEDKIFVFHMRILVQMVNTVGIKKRAATFNAMNDISFFKEQFGEIGSVLPGDTGDKGCFWHY
jgi:hypothetical protein